MPLAHATMQGHGLIIRCAILRHDLNLECRNLAGKAIRDDCRDDGACALRRNL